MNLKNTLAVLLLNAALFSCSKESTNNGGGGIPVYGCKDPTSINYNPLATVDNGTCQYQGNAIFWYNSGGTNATVTIHTTTGDVKGTINGSYYYNSTPACGSNYCANFTLPIGTYTFTASSLVHNWSGTIIITANGCSNRLLN
ncbi:hypothetical protein [Ferruginibacter albus]|uniref:hypothetical protein n=1 Tax=Ferruginibacter albus TaxID=2875540 RepID=UPI001CC4D0CD|nr:hypothetical protein [Ferruginibacter albus]UAY52881.1 hypothetical protein K9M53_04180 [Ferruginibacter albus]